MRALIMWSKCQACKNFYWDLIDTTSDYFKGNFDCAKWSLEYLNMWSVCRWKVIERLIMYQEVVSYELATCCSIPNYDIPFDSSAAISSWSYSTLLQNVYEYLTIEEDQLLQYLWLAKLGWVSAFGPIWLWDSSCTYSSSIGMPLCENFECGKGAY